jgi:hypothetical protein
VLHVPQRHLRGDMPEQLLEPTIGTPACAQ